METIDLPDNVVMYVSSDAYVRVLWAFAIALAKAQPRGQPALGAELVLQLRKLDDLVPASTDNSVEAWSTLVEAHANELLDALGYQGDRSAPGMEPPKP